VAVLVSANFLVFRYGIFHARAAAPEHDHETP
jgi:hypothetical protein